MNTQMQSTSGHSPPPGGRGGSGPAERAVGIVHQVDLVGRDLAILLPSGLQVFDIPPDCPIYLHGEQIKLRMVQPRDRVWITFRRRPQRLVAEKLEVQPDSGFACFRL